MWCVTGTTLSVSGKSCGKKVIMVVNNDVIEYSTYVRSHVNSAFGVYK